MQGYDSEFYRGRDEQTRFAAETILTLVQSAVPPLSSAIDLGCGVGTWLGVLRERGVQDIRGIDGDWVRPDALVIPSACFTSHRLDASDLPADRRYDLAISLEVAEHLPPERADPFVTRLTELGDFILFSAAIPGQGGVNHVNEQWPEYWIDRFRQRGYVSLDIIRKTHLGRRSYRRSLSPERFSLREATAPPRSGLRSSYRSRDLLARPSAAVREQAARLAQSDHSGIGRAPGAGRGRESAAPAPSRRRTVNGCRGARDCSGAFWP